MSGIYIPGMEMPKSCFFCPFRNKVDPDDIMCIVTREVFCETFAGTIKTRNRGNCPLVSVSDHGDLIDRQAFRYEMDKHYPFDKSTQSRHGIEDVLKSAVLRMLFNAPTIIPADIPDMNVGNKPRGVEDAAPYAGEEDDDGETV